MFKNNRLELFSFSSVIIIKEWSFKRFMELDIKVKEYISFQNKRKVVNLYKNFLILIEDLREDGYNISEEKYQRLRKRVLDSGNDAIRQFEEDLNNINL